MPENDLNKGAAPSDVEIREALAYERGQNEILRGVASRGQAPARPIEDPFKKWTDGLDPAEAAEKGRALDHGTRLRARDEAVRVGRALEGDFNNRLGDMEARLAMNNVLRTNPDMQEDPEGFAAASAAAEFDARSRGLNLDPSSFYDLTAKKYRATHPLKATPPVHVEGGGNPGGYGGVPDPDNPDGKNFLEDFYGFDAGEIEPIGKDKMAMSKLVTSYIDGKNDGLQKEGFRSRDIPSFLLRKPKKKAAAAATKA